MSEAKPDPRLARVLAMANWKGGAGKTTLTANLSKTMADAGMKVLMVDMDLSNNLAIDLGLTGHPENDNGAGLMAAVAGGEPLRPVKSVRPGLDWVPGGMEFRWVSKADQTAAARSFSSSLAQVADDYDLIILDCPPSNPDIIELVLSVSRYVLVPTKSDPANWDGIAKLGPFVHRARAANPMLTWLGLIIFDIDSQATSVLKSTRDHLNQYGIPVLAAHVRHSARAAHFTRLRGQLLDEFARAESETSLKDILTALEARRLDPSVVIPSRGSGSAADSLQGDYERIAEEVVHLIASHEQHQGSEASA